MKNITTIILTIFCASLFAQDNSTMYFVKHNPLQHQYNPAFRPEYNFYIGMPALSKIGLSLGNSSLTVNDVIYNANTENGKETVLFLNKNVNGGIDNFLDAFGNKLTVFSRLNYDIVQFGFKVKKSYFNVNISAKTDIQVSAPGSLINLALKGMNEEGINTYSLDEFNINANAYSELGLGYSYEINEKLTVGAKAKLLIGLASIKSDFNNLKLNASKEKWEFTGDAEIIAALPGLRINTDEDEKISDIEIDEDLSTSEYTEPSGKGFAFDLGATYKILPQLQISASIVDLGFLKWDKNIQAVKKEGDFIFDGIEYDINDDSTKYGEKYEKMAEEMFKVNKNISSFKNWLTAKVFFGAEYSILNDKIGFGLLSKTYINKDNVNEELMLSANFRPARLFSASLSYSLIDGAFSNLGCGVNFNFGPANIFFAMDRIPLYYTEYESIPVPSRTKTADFTMGINFLFGKNKKEGKEIFVETGFNPALNLAYHYDSDGDGIPDNIDKCPDTEDGVAVDSTGCPADSDNDGVPDYIDQCPDTDSLIAGYVNSVGCDAAIDNDNDGVCDYADKCPDTPSDSVAYVNEYGCTSPDSSNVKTMLVIDTIYEKASLSEEEQRIIDNMKYGVYYKSNGIMALEEKSSKAIDPLVSMMNNNEAYVIKIKTHTELRKTKGFAYMLSKEHAQLIRSYMILEGIDASRIWYEGIGAEEPIASNKTEDGRRKNRRTEIEVYKTSYQKKTIRID